MKGKKTESSSTLGQNRAFPAGYRWHHLCSSREECCWSEGENAVRMPHITVFEVH